MDNLIDELKFEINRNKKKLEEFLNNGAGRSDCAFDYLDIKTDIEEAEQILEDPNIFDVYRVHKNLEMRY